jgi:hypothetical protein
LLVAGQTVIERAHFTDAYVGKAPRMGEVALQAGAHPISVWYYQSYGGAHIALDIEGPGIGRTRVQGPLLTHLVP